MILLIDNYDSFSYNLYQLIGSVRDDIKVIRNDELTLGEIDALKPEYIFLSPGPKRPEDAGVCIEAAKYFAGKVPVMGVCLGHQAITAAFGGEVLTRSGSCTAKPRSQGLTPKAEFSSECPIPYRRRGTIRFRLCAISCRNACG